jgi:hypothetical protein
MTVLERRRIMAGGLGALALGGGAAAQPQQRAAAPAANGVDTAQVVFGRDGWLFGAWEDVRRVDLNRTRELCRFINAAVAVLSGAGMKVALCITPMKARVYQEFLPPTFQMSPEATQRYGVVMEELARGDAVQVDHATQFAGLRRSSRDALYFKADIHWTPAGGAAAATDLAKAVKEKAGLPAPRKPGTRLGDYLSMRYESNDLATFLPPDQRSRFPYEQFRVRRIMGAPQGVGLIEEDQADTVIVGNSFMQTGFGFPPMFSNQLDRAVSLAVQVGRFGPYATLLNYLRSDLFRNDRPKLLVWHFLEGNMEVMPDNAGYWGSSAMPARQFNDELRRLVRR